METTTKPVESKIRLTEKNDGAQIVIPAKGLRGKGLVTILIIAAWLVTILVWTVILLMMKPMNALYSIPFWFIGLLTLVKAINILRLEQTITLEKGAITLKLTQGNKYDQKTFNIDNTTVSMIEGSYYSHAGLSRRGQFPAIIFNNQSYSFAERLTPSEKSWLIQYIREFYQF